MTQVMMTGGAIILLVTAILSMNRGLASNTDLLLGAKVGITSVSLCESIVEEATGQAFDKATDSAAVTTTASLTPVASLGMEAGESYPKHINDFDDFNNLTKLDTISESPNGQVIKVVYTTKCKVVYVDPSTPDVASASPTWNKKLTVTVKSNASPDSTQSTYIFSYWYFR